MNKEFEEWYKSLKAKPGQMPYDDWFVCMREAYFAGYTAGEIDEGNWNRYGDYSDCR